MADRCSIEAAKLLRQLKEGLKEGESEALMETARKAILKKTRAAAVRNSGESAEEALANAAEEYLQEQLKTAFLVKRNALLNLNRRLELVAYVQREFADDPALGIEAIMTGVNRAKKSSRFSVASEQTALGNKYLLGFMSDVKKSGLWREFVRGVHDLDASRALFRMADATDSLEDIPKDAVTLGRVIQKWQNEARNDANKAGAFIGDLAGYITRQTHDMFRIRQAAKRITGQASNDQDVNFQAWVDFILPLLDEEKTFVDIDLEQTTTLKVLRDVYDALESGVHLTNSAPGEAGKIPGGLNSVAKRMSKERLLHFRDGDAWFAYNEKFGMGSLSETVARGLELSANQTGLMRVFGPNARMNFDALFSSAQLMAKRKGGGGRKLLDRQAKRLDDIFAELDGSTRIPGNEIWARRGGVIRAIQSMSKLGFATLSAISDIPIAASALRFQGVGFLESYGSVFKSVRNAFDSSADRLELSSMMGVSMDSVRGDIVARFSSDDSIPGWTSSMMGSFFKFNGLSIWTDAIRNGVGDAMSHRLALNKSVSWRKLNKDLARTLDFYGIGENEWNVIRAGEGKDFSGETFVTPEGIDGVDDALVDRLIGERLTDLQTRHADLIERDVKTNEKDIAFVEERQKKFSSEMEKATDDLALLRKAFAGREDDLATEIQGRISRLEGEFSRAEAVSDIESFVVSERNRGRVTELLQRIEEGTDLDGPGVGIRELAARESDRFSQNRGNRGERLGERRARSERRISQAKSKERRVSRQLSKNLSKQEADLVRSLEKRAKTFNDFVKRADERMTKRKDRAIELDNQFHRRVRRLRDEAKLNVQRRLRSYFQDQVDFAVVTPDAKTQAFMNRGTRRGTVEGDFLRMMMQFKSFPIAVIQRPVSRELFARGFSGPRRGGLADLVTALKNGNGEMQGLANLVVATTLMGYLAMSSKDLAKGKTPRDPNDPETWFAALTQGGGLGIYGDFLFGQVKNRFGGSVTNTIAGPTIGGTFTDLFDLWQRFREGDDVAASAFSDLINLVPFSNIFYLRTAMDFLILHRIREGLNPGYLERMERRIERENAQTFLLQPSSIIPRGGGSIGRAAGSVGELIDSVGFGGDD